MKRLRIATRRSALALWQAEHVAARLRDLHPDLHVELLPLSTRGDEILDRSLAAIGGKGLFLKELELALQDGRADLAVHSAKDVPVELDAGFELAVILEREDPLDALVTRDGSGFEDLRIGARVGTSSLRRQLQLRALRPDIEVLEIRGNVQSRLARVDACDVDAAILACAGLMRLGMTARIAERLLPPDWVPAAAQGALAIEVQSGNDAVTDLVSPLAHAPSALCIAAERGVTRALQGSCQVPLAAFAQFSGATIELAAWVAGRSSGRVLRATAQAAVTSTAAAEALAATVAESLLLQGARKLLDE